jgi:hypothetical protein
MLAKYREELTRPIDEAMEFLKRVEAQLDSITGGSHGSARLSLAGKAMPTLLSLLLPSHLLHARVFYLYICIASCIHVGVGLGSVSGRLGGRLATLGNAVCSG